MKRIFHSTIKSLMKTVVPGHRPNFILVGAQKAGTTSLHYYLNQHSKIVGSIPKEVRFFDRDDHFAMGEQWYKMAFRDLRIPFKRGLYFEATPEYMYRSYAAQRIHDFDPNLKIVMILREPIARAYSAWNMYRDFPHKFKKLPGRLDAGYIHDKANNIVRELYEADHFPSFEEAFEAEMVKLKTNSEHEEPSFFRRGLYLPQIKRFHNLFGCEKVLILGFKDLIQKREDTLNKVLKFVGLPESDWDFLDGESKNVREYPARMSEEIKEKLQTFYGPHNENLFKYLRTTINW